jgi:hypothetical protein
MLAKLFGHLRQQWMGALALLLVLSGGVAYAANTVGSSDIIDESILSQDLKNSQVASVDLKNNAVQGVDVRGNTLTGGDIQDNSLTGQDIANPSLSGEDVLDDSLTGFQIDESTLDLPTVQERAKRIDYQQPDTDGTMREIGYQNGLHIYAMCTQSGSTTMKMFAKSDFEEATWSSLLAATGSGATAADHEPPEGAYFAFSPQVIDYWRLHPGDPPKQILIPDDDLGLNSGSGFADALATGIYRSAGAEVTVNLQMLANGAGHSCRAWGSMVSATDPG